ncbi:hypothetical protein U9M48_037835 [Paspalum notatum var. saurae]|uniref:Uncharacterized protein n=1 Tax=Paspalum notatum var. saurae TaxID=547442 RepID=A0AAQ3UK34_PASNO
MCCEDCREVEEHAERLPGVVLLVIQGLERTSSGLAWPEEQRGTTRMAGTAAMDRESAREGREKKQGSKGKKEKEDVKVSHMSPERSTEQEASALRKRRREMRALTNGEEDGAGGERTPGSGTDGADWSGGVRSEGEALPQGLRKAPTGWRGGGAGGGGVEVPGGQKEADLSHPPMVGVEDTSSMVPPSMASPWTRRRGGSAVFEALVGRERTRRRRKEAPRGGR